jgi:WD40 repeat protein
VGHLHLDGAVEPASERIELLSGLVFSREGRLIAAGTEDQQSRYRQAWVWDVESGREEEVSQLGRGQRGQAVFSPDGHTLASTDWDGTLRVWDLPRLPAGKAVE